MNFATLLEQEQIILLDGAMGTQLDKRGLMGHGRCNLDTPQIVLEIHNEYVHRGCCGTTPAHIRKTAELLKKRM